MKAYDLEDKTDLQRFKLSLMCRDVGATIDDHVSGHRIGVLPPTLADKYLDFIKALKALEDATTPGGKPETGGTL